MLRIIRERILPKIGPWSIAGFAAVCLAAVAAIVGLCSLRNHVVSLPAFNFERIIIAKPPKWAPQDPLVAEIRVDLPKEANLFDRDLLKKVYKSCKDLYWIEQIDSVRKVYPNTLRLKMKLRTPAAYVLYGGELYLVDLKGRRLPRRYYRKPDGAANMLYIKGIGGSPPEPGKKWSDHEALMAAIAVVNEIDKMGQLCRKADITTEDINNAKLCRKAGITIEDIDNAKLCRKAGITTVDAANFGGRKKRTYSNIVLWTENQTRILWGRSSINHKFGDLSTEEKLANLEKALREYSNFSRVEYVNVYSVANQCPGKYRSGGR